MEYENDFPLVHLEGGYYEDDEKVKGDKEKGDDNSEDKDDDEEKEEEEKDEDKSKEAPPQESDDEDKKIGSTIHNTMVKLGIFNEDEEFDGSLDKLEDKFKGLPQAVADAIISDANPIIQNLLAYSFERGDKLTRQEIKAFLDIEDANDAIPSDEELADNDKARAYLKKDYIAKNKDADDEEVEDYLDKLETKGKLSSRAKSIAEKDRESIAEQVKAKIEAEKQNNIKAEKQRQEFFQTISKELDSTSWNKKVKAEVIENLKPDVLVRKNEQIRKSPKALIQLANIYRMFDEKTGTFDFSSIEKEGESKATNKVKESIIKDSYNSSGNKDGKGDKKEDKSTFKESGLILKTR